MGKMTKNGAKKKEKTEISFLVHIMYFTSQSLFLLYVLAPFWLIHCLENGYFFTIVLEP